MCKILKLRRIFYIYFRRSKRHPGCPEIHNLPQNKILFLCFRPGFSGFFLQCIQMRKNPFRKAALLSKSIPGCFCILFGVRHFRRLVNFSLQHGLIPFPDIIAEYLNADIFKSQILSLSVRHCGGICPFPIAVEERLPRFCRIRITCFKICNRAPSILRYQLHRYCVVYAAPENHAGIQWNRMISGGVQASLLGICQSTVGGFLQFHIRIILCRNVSCVNLYQIIIVFKCIKRNCFQLLHILCMKNICRLLITDGTVVACAVILMDFFIIRHRIRLKAAEFTESRILIGYPEIPAVSPGAAPAVSAQPGSICFWLPSFVRKIGFCRRRVMVVIPPYNAHRMIYVMLIRIVYLLQCRC